MRNNANTENALNAGKSVDLWWMVMHFLTAYSAYQYCVFFIMSVPTILVVPNGQSWGFTDKVMHVQE